MFNNRRAKRFSNRKYRINIINEELYLKWKSLNNYNITFKQFKEYWKIIARTIVKNIVEEADGVRLGGSIGDMYIGYIPKTRAKGIDYKTSLELGKPVYHENWDTNGKLAKIIYGTNHRRYIYKYHAWWSFKACRNFKNKVKDALKTYPLRYKNSIEKRSLI